MNRTYRIVLWGALLAAGLMARAGAYDTMTESDKQAALQQHYQRAIAYFNDGEYAKAIQHWEDILKLDPEQSAPPEMIRQARVKLAEVTSPQEQALLNTVKEGRYSAALDQARSLTARDPGSEKFRTYAARLEAVAALRPEETGSGRAADMVRRSIHTHLTRDDEARFAINAMRHARDLNPRHAAINELVTYMEDQYPDTTKKETITPGMTVVDYKLFIALNHIYEGRYDLAIFDCNEVLELDPANILALKRKGSAYFALKHKDKARELWQQALKLSPNDTEIKQFLAEK
jgi:Tfp pilus assembly protein PilF